MRSLRSISTTRDSSVRPNLRNSSGGSTASRWHTNVSCRVTDTGAVALGVGGVPVAGQHVVDDHAWINAHRQLGGDLTYRDVVHGSRHPERQVIEGIIAGQVRPAGPAVDRVGMQWRPAGVANPSEFPD